MKRAKKVWAFLIDSTCFIYMVAAVISFAYGLVTGGVAGFVDAVILMSAVAFAAFTALVLISFIFTVIWGRDVLGK